MAPVALEACRRAGVTPADITAFVPHQANLRIVEAIARRLGIPRERVADDIVPLVEGELAGNERRAAAIAVLDDLHQIAPLVGGEPVRAPVVEDQQIGLDQGAEQAGEATVTVGKFEIGEQPRHAGVQHRIAIPARLLGERAG